MAYTPELSRAASAILRRIAWAVNMPMTQTINRIFEELPKILNKNEICECCKDNTACNL